MGSKWKGFIPAEKIAKHKKWNAWYHDTQAGFNDLSHNSRLWKHKVTGDPDDHDHH